MSASRAASTAARILRRASSRGVTRRGPSMWPHFFGQSWSSIRMQAAPARAYSDVHRVAVARVAVGDHRIARYRSGQAAQLVHHLSEADEARVGQAEARRGDAESAHERGGEPGFHGEPRAQGIVQHRANEKIRLGQKPAKPCGGWIHEFLPVLCQRR
jgi:hypothetical protein